MSKIDFQTEFTALTGNAPFPWQTALFERLIQGETPKSLNIPTGLGKTAIIPIWLIALAVSPTRVPRRLIYVVNRRTVVDQATNEAELIRERLSVPLREALAHLCSFQADWPLALSTLRGEFADNREWSGDPGRPAIIVGTVDMIGSRLLFSGYGVGFRARPLHAGFLGHDALLVHDEAHLEPAFQKLLEQIQAEQTQEAGELGPAKGLQVLEMSATSRGSASFGLQPADRALPAIQKRIHAHKKIALHPLEDEKQLPDKLAALAIGHAASKRAILVFARSVENVDKVAEAIRKAMGAADHVETLTGTLRGKERDELVKKPLFKRFLPQPEPGGETVYLVCTSAGEVGVNISADHLVCDLSTYESMAQRFGRVNRFGNTQDTQIDVVHPVELIENSKDEFDVRRWRTLELLKILDGNGSPAALDALDGNQKRAAFSPDPEFLASSDILFDRWAMTSVRDRLPGRPPVEPFLHGVTDREPPQTQVAWREEVGILNSDHFNEKELGELLDVFPLKPLEILRDRTDRVLKRLETLAKTHTKKSTTDQETDDTNQSSHEDSSTDANNLSVWVVDQEGTIKVHTLAELAELEVDDLAYRTVILPPKAGGLSGGLFTGNAVDKADDVSTLWMEELKTPEKEQRARRARTWNEPTPPKGMRLVQTIDTKPDTEEDQDEETSTKKRYWYWFVRTNSADDDGSRSSQWAVRWHVHTADVTQRATSIASQSEISDALKQALVLAAKHHDLGKRRTQWQRDIGNPEPTNWLAKSGKDKTGKLMARRELIPYRHEFGSLVDVEAQADFLDLSDEQKDFVLHLIASHHGYSRPHFPADLVIDPEAGGKDLEALAAQIPTRFARLQRKYGRWGLAYLESLLRAADYAASANPSQTLEHEK